MSLLRALFPTVLSIVIASPAIALSCLPYSPRQAFQDASESPDRYVVVRGRLQFNAANLPHPDMARQDLIEPDNYMRAGVVGLSLTGNGFNARFVHSIQVNVQCYAAWCGSLSSGSEQLLFLKQTGTGYLLETNPCGGFAFEAVPETVYADMHQCLLGEDCTPPRY